MKKRLILTVFAALAAAPAFAQAPAAKAPPGAAGGDMQTMLVFMGAIFILFYFIVIRPQKQEQKKRESELDKVARGDRAVTIGGLHGTVEAINISKGTVSLTIAPKVTVEVNKSALASITPKGRGGESKDAKEEQKQIAEG